MKATRRTVSFGELKSASPRSSRAARASSGKTDTRCEILLRKEVFRLGLRYRLHGSDLPGRPDLVFPGPRVVVFCDGDFWHGRRFRERLSKLSRGHNAAYWVAKISRNVNRDRRQTRSLRAAGWIVVRYWETDILKDPKGVAAKVLAVVRARRD